MSTNDDRVMTSMALMNHPAWRDERPSARLRLGEGDAYALYTVLHEAEKDALAAYHHANAAGDPMAKRIRLASRRLERLRRKVLEVIETQGWNLPQ